MVIIGKHIEGISLNPLEFLLDKPKGNPIEFETKEEAKQYLRDHGIEDEEALEDCFVYHTEEEE